VKNWAVESGVEKEVKFGHRVKQARWIEEDGTRFVERTAWSSTCSSWFKNGEKHGPVTAI
jgi:hypothetical protein